MANLLCCCCFSNDIRHLVLFLSIACSSVLFANLLIFNVAVVFKTDFPFSSQDRQFDVFNVTKGALVRKTRRAGVETDSLYPNDEAYQQLNFLELSSDTENTTLAEDIANLKKKSNADIKPDGHPVVLPEFDVTRPPTSTSSASSTTLKTVFFTRSPVPIVKPITSNHPLSFATSTKAPVPLKFDDKDIPQNTLQKLDEKAKNNDMTLMVPDSTTQEAIFNVSTRQRVKFLMVWVTPGFGMLFGSILSIWLIKPVGVKNLFGIALIICAIATLFLGFIINSKSNEVFISCARFVQGFAFGSVLPVIGTLTANWATLKEQFSFLVCSHLFLQIAPLGSWPVFAWLSNISLILPFIIHSVAAVLLALIWLLFYCERPHKHPWVNGLELNKIVTGKIKTATNRSLRRSIPSLLTSSLPVWAVWISSFSYFVVIALVLQYLPIYCYFILKWEHAVYKSALPFLLMLLFTLLYPLWRRLANLCNAKVSSAFFNTSSFLLSATVFIFLALSPQDFRFSGVALAILLLALVLSLYGFYRSAVLVGRFFTQFIVSYSQIGVAVAFIFVSALVFFFDRPSCVSEWRTIFIVISVVQLIAAAIFMVIGAAEPEDWSKTSWDPSAGRRMVSVDQIDFHNEECGFLEMKLINK